MLLLAYAKNDKKLSKEAFLHYLDMLPLYFQDKVRRYHKWEDSQACLIGKLILQYILSIHQSQYKLTDIRFTDTGRPYINDCFDFNITHSGSYVVCAYSDEGKVGIDLEIIDQIELNSFEKIFTKNEFDQITSSVNAYVSFYTFWTIKEAAVKADGRGLIIPLKNVNVQAGKVFIEDNEWCYRKVNFKDNYILHIVIDKPIETPIPLLSMDFYVNKVHHN